MRGLPYQLKSVLRDKFCLMTFLLPILVAVALNFVPRDHRMAGAVRPGNCL